MVFEQVRFEKISGKQSPQYIRSVWVVWVGLLIDLYMVAKPGFVLFVEITYPLKASQRGTLADYVSASLPLSPGNYRLA